MLTIPLTHGKFALIDDEDAAIVAGIRWSAVRARQKRENWYAIAKSESRHPIWMHRLITGAGDSEEVHHRDDDGLNNRRLNLRICTRSLNCAAIQYPNPKSGFRGVYWEPREQRWCAQATINRRTVRIGRFRDPFEAARARDQFVSKLYGEFAVLNFKESPAS